MKIIEYKEMKLLKQSEKSTVLLVSEVNGDKVFVRKVLQGQHPIYSELKNCIHPYLPKVYEVNNSGDTTTIIEEYVEGQSLGSAQLSEKQVVKAIKELCTVLEFLHGKDIIHRDIKPSNIILASDGHIRLIDFDAARMPKEDLEQDTKLLGTRGYAPPEQYGFSQTDARADIYSLGITFEQLLGDKAHKPHYRRIVGKCTNLNPDKRYQFVRQVKRAFSSRAWSVLIVSIGIILLAASCYMIPQYLSAQQDKKQPVSASLAVLPAPENPHWNNETGVAVWGNVPDSGSEGEVSYFWRLYRQDAATQPNLKEAIPVSEGRMGGNRQKDQTNAPYELNVGKEFQENGFYYFTVAADGDGVRFSDSPYVLSDAFEYTGEDAPRLPTPASINWNLIDGDEAHFAAWSNFGDYADTDTFEVRVYNQSGAKVATNIWTKNEILNTGYGGVWLNPKIFEESEKYRFTVQAQTSRPNEFRSSLMPDPVPEEYFSPWYAPSDY